MPHAWKLTGQKVSLADYDTRANGGLTKEEAEPLLARLNERLRDMQETMYAAQQHAVLVVLQGMDTSGKDGTVKNVFGGVNPQGCIVVSFKRPTEEELAHDFLWRIHRRTPPKGIITVFNRSHYEDVLIARVRGLVPEKVWRVRYDDINAFEKVLTDSNTIVIKCFLHISRDEQAERLKAREDEVDKRWKLNAADFVERGYWDDYQRAYEVALERCATPEAPWHIIPADRKWYRNLAVAETIVECLAPYEGGWHDELHARGERNYQELLESRAR
jgi:PPK2 family polyphosphate:nucleotide phosphotransferase